MISNTRLILGIATACIALGASAQTISEGSTGYIGLTASAGRTPADDPARQAARAGAMQHTAAGEAATINDGRPMRTMQPMDAKADGVTGQPLRMDTQRMGASASRMLVEGGTPD